MKIAWLINLYPPYMMGGNEILAQNVILELRARGHEVYVLTGRGQNLPRDVYHLSPINFDLDRMGERFLGTRTRHFMSPCVGISSISTLTGRQSGS